MDSIYKSKTYRSFVAGQLEKRGRGARTWLTKTIGVQASYLWSVLSGKQDFTPEQLLLCAEAFQLNSFETEILLLMLNRDRAASIKVKDFYQKQLDRLFNSKSEIQKHIRSASEVMADNLIEFCSDWLYLAVTIAIQNKKLRTPKDLSERFNVDLKRMNEVLRVIEKTGLIFHNGNEYIPTQNRFHIGKNHAAIKLHHQNWRQKALESIDRKQNEDELHYTSVMSIDAATFKQIRNLLLRSIERLEPGIKTAKDEEMAVLVIDLFHF